MLLRELLTKEELEEVIKKEFILKNPNYDEIDWNIERHYLDLTIEQYMQLRIINLLSDIKGNLEVLNLNTENL